MTITVDRGCHMGRKMLCCTWAGERALMMCEPYYKYFFTVPTYTSNIIPLLHGLEGIEILITSLKSVTSESPQVPVLSNSAHSEGVVGGHGVLAAEGALLPRERSWEKQDTPKSVVFSHSSQAICTMESQALCTIACSDSGE